MYLHGFCNKWVANNYQDGDEILVIIALDECYEFHHLIHCCLIRDGMFVDVRGATDNFDNVLEDFEDDYFEDYMSDYVCNTLDEFLYEMNKVDIVT